MPPVLHRDLLLCLYICACVCVCVVCLCVCVFCVCVVCVIMTIDSYNYLCYDDLEVPVRWEEI